MTNVMHLFEDSHQHLVKIRIPTMADTFLRSTRLDPILPMPATPSMLTFL